MSRAAVRNRYREFQKQAAEIDKQGVPVDNPCSFCERRGFCCIMDSKSRNCAACTRRGKKCEPRFHSDSQWDSLNRDRDMLDAQIDEAENQLEVLFAKLKNLKTRRKFLNERGRKMLDHDSNIMGVLNERDPLNAEDLQELERLVDEQEAAQLAAVSNDPSLTQMMNSPSFWENFDSAVAGGIPSPTGGNPSSSQ